VSGDDTCASLDDPLTLVVALMVDSPGQAEPAEPEATPEPLAQKPAPPPAERAPEQESNDAGEILTAPSLERALAAPTHAVFMGLGLLSMGALPAAAVGGALVATLKPRGFWGLGVEVGVLAPQDKALGNGSLEVSLLVLRGSLCPLQGVDGKAWWSACANMGAARLHTESHDLLDSKSRNEWLPLPGASVRAAWLPGHDFLLGAGLEAAFPISPDRYVYRDPQGMRQPAFEMSQLMITVNLGIGILID
jgi:hypothetical protein